MQFFDRKSPSIPYIKLTKNVQKFLQCHKASFISLYPPLLPSVIAGSYFRTSASKPAGLLKQYKTNWSFIGADYFYYPRRLVLGRSEISSEFLSGMNNYSSRVVGFFWGAWKKVVCPRPAPDRYRAPDRDGTTGLSLSNRVRDKANRCQSRAHETHARTRPEHADHASPSLRPCALRSRRQIFTKAREKINFRKYVPRLSRVRETDGKFFVRGNMEIYSKVPNWILNRHRIGFARSGRDLEIFPTPPGYLSSRGIIINKQNISHLIALLIISIIFNVSSFGGKKSSLVALIAATRSLRI